MGRWDKSKSNEPIISMPKSQLRNYLALFGGMGIIVGYLLCMGLS